jgi:SAM-dependent methyltransferase
MNRDMEKSLLSAARFYDGKKVGDTGPLGFRRSTDLMKLKECIDGLLERKILNPGKSLFLDMGCGDGRVNVLFSYLVRKSIGIEMDEWTLDEYIPLKQELLTVLGADRLMLPPENIFLFQGDSRDAGLHESIQRQTGVGFEDFDLFYTYLTLQDEFAELIAQRAKAGAVFMVYGLDRIMPRHRDLRLLTPGEPLKGILALYQKKGGSKKELENS